jgi:hypothetical protein
MSAVYAEWLAALETSGLGHAARHSSWFFTVANLLHVLGAAFVVGGIGVFDLTVLSARSRGAAEVARVAIPLAGAGLALQIPTGFVLLAVEATKLGVNPAFLAKTGLIAVGIVNLAVFHARFGSVSRGVDLPPSARISAAVSLGAWDLALLAGRMIAYL